MSSAAFWSGLDRVSSLCGGAEWVCASGSTMTVAGIVQISSGDGARFCEVVKKATRALFEAVAIPIGILQC